MKRSFREIANRLDRFHEKKGVAPLAIVLECFLEWPEPLDQYRTFNAIPIYKAEMPRCCFNEDKIIFIRKRKEASAMAKAKKSKKAKKKKTNK